MTNQIQSFVVTLQSESLRSLTDRNEFDRIRAECVDKLRTLVAEYEEDAQKLGVKQQADNVTSVAMKAIQEIPFPEEAVVTHGDIVSGFLSHLTGARSANDQVRDRFDQLTRRYEAWWGRYGPRIAAALNDFQKALINSM